MNRTRRGKALEGLLELDWSRAAEFLVLYVVAVVVGIAQIASLSDECLKRLLLCEMQAICALIVVVGALRTGAGIKVNEKPRRGLIPLSRQRQERVLGLLTLALGVITFATVRFAMSRILIPDLVVSSIASNRGDERPDSLGGILVTISNRGTATAAACSVLITVPQAQGLSSTLAERKIVPLAPGQATTLLLTVADDGVPAGPGVFRVFVDAGNAVQEVSEDNNVLMEYIYVRP